MHTAMHNGQAVRQGCFSQAVIGPRPWCQPICQQVSRNPQQHQYQQQQCCCGATTTVLQQRTTHVARAEPPTSSPNGSNTPATSSSLIDSDLSFLLKLMGFSFAGAAVIKYGSLLISLPFEPSAAAALTVVLGTPAAYSLYLLTQSGNKQQQ